MREATPIGDGFLIKRALVGLRRAINKSDKWVLRPILGDVGTWFRRRASSRWALLVAACVLSFG